MQSEGFYVNEKSTDTSWDRTSDLPICSTASKPMWKLSESKVKKRWLEAEDFVQ